MFGTHPYYRIVIICRKDFIIIFNRSSESTNVTAIQGEKKKGYFSYCYINFMTVIFILGQEFFDVISCLFIIEFVSLTRFSTTNLLVSIVSILLIATVILF